MLEKKTHLKAKFKALVTSRYRFLYLTFALFIILAPISLTLRPSDTIAANPIVLENAKSGTTAWQSANLQESLNNQGSQEGFGGNGAAGSSDWTDTALRGYASAQSINVGGSINFYVGTKLPSYSMQIYRMGWYGGAGARLIKSVSGLPGKNQAVPAWDPSTLLLQLKWSTSYTLQTDATWASGVYLNKLVGSDGTVAYIIFVIRDDSSTASIVYQLPLATYQAYNNWGGPSLYVSPLASPTRAYKVSFDRPYASGSGAGDFFSGDYGMIRFLESKGYNVTYAASSDTQTTPGLMNNHKIFLSNWHDEYWSKEMRDNLTAWRNTGKNIAFFGGNDVYWQIRYEPSSSGVANRVITCYKAASLDPLSASNPTLTTVRWRDPPVNLPENALLGGMYVSLVHSSDPSVPWVVSNSNNWIYNGTGLANGDAIAGLVGNEFDGVANNGASPAGVVSLSNSPVVDEYGNTDLANGSVYVYAPSGAIVFNAATIRWAWKLDDNTYQAHGADARVQRITTNVLDAMLNGIPSVPPLTLGATPYRNAVLSDNPLAYWRLGDAPGSAQAADETGHGHAGTYSGGVTLGAPGALDRDANTMISSAGTGTVTVPDLGTTTNFTIEGWTYLTDANWNATTNYNNALYGKSGDVRLLIRPGTANTKSTVEVYAGVWLGGKEYTLTVPNNASNVNQWAYWALTRSGAALTLYRNGVQIAKRIDLPSSTTVNITGNILSQSGAYYLKGRVDEVAVYNTALASSRILAHYNGGFSPYKNAVLNDNPFAYWRLGDAPGSAQAADETGHGHAGTYNGGISLGAKGYINHSVDSRLGTDGTGFVAIPDLGTTTNFTIEGWTYLADAYWLPPGYNNTLYGTGGNVRLLVRPGSANTKSTVEVYAGVWLGGKEYTLTVPNNASNVGQRVYWALTRSGAALTLYRNGVQIAKRIDLPSSTTVNITGDLLAQSGSSYFLQGGADDVAVYKSALSASQVSAHYASGL